MYCHASLLIYYLFFTLLTETFHFLILVFYLPTVWKQCTWYTVCCLFVHDLFSPWNTEEIFLFATTFCHCHNICSSLFDIDCLFRHNTMEWSLLELPHRTSRWCLTLAPQICGSLPRNASWQTLLVVSSKIITDPFANIGTNYGNFLFIGIMYCAQR